MDLSNVPAYALETPTSSTTSTNPLKRFNAWAATKLVGLKSKIWAALLGSAGALTIVMGMFDVIDVREYIPAEYAGWALLAIALINYWLRVITVVEQHAAKTTGQDPE